MGEFLPIPSSIITACSINNKKPSYSFNRSNGLISIIWGFGFCIFAYASSFYMLKVFPSLNSASNAMFNSTKFWFFISNTLILIIAADSGALSSSDSSSSTMIKEEKKKKNHLAVATNNGNVNLEVVTDKSIMINPQYLHNQVEMPNYSNLEIHSQVPSSIFSADDQERKIGHDETQMQKDAAKELYVNKSSDQETLMPAVDEAIAEVAQIAPGTMKDVETTITQEEEEEEENDDCQNGYDDGEYDWEDGDDDDDDELSKLSNEELNKRVEEFIQKFNSQIRQQAPLNLRHSYYY